MAASYRYKNCPECSSPNIYECARVEADYSTGDYEDVIIYDCLSCGLEFNTLSLIPPKEKTMADDPTTAHEAAAFWGSAESNSYTVDQRLTMALQALTFYGDAYCEQEAKDEQKADDYDWPEFIIFHENSVVTRILKRKYDKANPRYEPFMKVDSNWSDACTLVERLNGRSSSE